MRQFVRSLPQHDRTKPILTPAVYEQYQPGFGAMLLNMLRNRNLNWVASTKVLYLLTGPILLSAATIGIVGHNRKELTPELLADFATLLGIPAGDLAALAGIEPPDVISPRDPTPVDMAELIWDARRRRLAGKSREQEDSSRRKYARNVSSKTAGWTAGLGGSTGRHNYGRWREQHAEIEGMRHDAVLDE